MLSLLITDRCFSQSKTIKKIARKVSSDDLKKNIYYLCNESLEGRMTATHGDTLASLYIADWFKKQNLKAPTIMGKITFNLFNWQEMLLKRLC
jgi:hypothetical protein